MITGVAALLAPALPKGASGGIVHGLFTRLWNQIGLGGRITVFIALAAALAYVLFLTLRWLGQSGMRTVLWSLTGVLLVGLASLGTWAVRLPVVKGSSFVLWHQFVRVGAVLCGAGFVICFMALMLPNVMNALEARGFVPCIATRHVRASKSGFLTVISFLSIFGVMLSSLALCAVVSIMGGFGADLKRKILGNNAHVKIEAKEYGGFEHWRDLIEQVRLVKGVHAATPVVQGEAMAASSSNNAGVIVRGVDTDTIGSVIDLIENIEVGKFKYLVDPVLLTKLPADEPIGIGPGGETYLKGPDVQSYINPDLDPTVKDVVQPPDTYPGVIIGRELAKTLHVYVGDEINLFSPLGDLGPAGVMPRMRRFRIAAIFYSGMYEYDASHAYITLDNAQEFLDMREPIAKISAIEIKADDAEQASVVRDRVEAALKDRPDLQVRDWKQMNKNLFSALKLEKIATFIILSIAIAVASFCIICTLLLMVTEKSKEIAILKALGASDNAILRVFMLEGVMIGGIGTVFGVITGLVLALGLLWFGVRLDPDVYYVDRLPIAVDPVDYALVALSALVITTLATIYPALAASRLRPVDGIRYE